MNQGTVSVVYMGMPVKVAIGGLRRFFGASAKVGTVVDTTKQTAHNMKFTVLLADGKVEKDVAPASLQYV